MDHGFPLTSDSCAVAGVAVRGQLPAPGGADDVAQRLQLVEPPAHRPVAHRSWRSVRIKTTKSGRPRNVPLTLELLELVRTMADGKQPDDHLVTGPGGGRLRSASVKRAIRWSQTGRRRRLHDLRHTAASLWLAAGVPVTTVQAWLGHSSLATTQIYVHHLGDLADATGLDVLNRRGHTWGTSPEVPPT